MLKITIYLSLTYIRRFVVAKGISVNYVVMDTSNNYCILGFSLCKAGRNMKVTPRPCFNLAAF